MIYRKLVNIELFFLLKYIEFIHYRDKILHDWSLWFQFLAWLVAMDIVNTFLIQNHIHDIGKKTILSEIILHVNVNTQ